MIMDVELHTSKLDVISYVMTKSSSAKTLGFYGIIYFPILMIAFTVQQIHIVLFFPNSMFF